MSIVTHPEKSENRLTAYRGIALVLLVCLSVQMTGCSLFVSSRQPFSVSSDPSGAEVTINGERVGTTPVQTTIHRRAEASVMVSKKGYETSTRTTSRSISVWGILDIVGTFLFLFPILGILGEGFWEQEPTNVNVNLSPKESSENHVAPRTPANIAPVHAG